MAPLHYAAKFDPVLSLDCAPTPSIQGKEGIKFCHLATLGAGSYGPDLFMDKDVVIVTINYRLGTLGFLSTGDDVIPGNMGMWDQVTMVARWL